MDLITKEKIDKYVIPVSVYFSKPPLYIFSNYLVKNFIILLVDFSLYKSCPAPFIVDQEIKK